MDYKRAKSSKTEPTVVELQLIVRTSKRSEWSIGVYIIVLIGM
jgi:hypothetical protein